MRKRILYGFYLKADALWEALEEALKEWLPPKQARTIVLDVKNSVPHFNWIVMLSGSTETWEEAEERLIEIEKFEGLDRVKKWGEMIFKITREPGEERKEA